MLQLSVWETCLRDHGLSGELLGDAEEEICSSGCWRPEWMRIQDWTHFS